MLLGDTRNDDDLKLSRLSVAHTEDVTASTFLMKSDMPEQLK